jgi:hypothetical protein
MSTQESFTDLEIIVLLVAAIGLQNQPGDHLLDLPSLAKENIRATTAEKILQQCKW